LKQVRDRIRILRYNLNTNKHIENMSNCKAEINVSNFIIDVSNEQEVMDALMEIMECDNDLTENEDYFQQDTLSLGYESEADRIVKEYIKENGVPKTTTEFENAFNEISKNVSSQEYFGECSTNFLKISENNLSVMFMTGG
tara:strand:+ start:101 stop:523 length:423 start_codon:yes stop_codon:yes gene_type:complete